MNRRQFIRAGVVGGAVLAAGGAWMTLRDRDDAAGAVVHQRRMEKIVAAIAGVILDGSLPPDPAERGIAVRRVSADVGKIVAGFTPPVRVEVHQLFSLLDMPVARRLLTGVPADWPAADPRDIASFLESWRRSSLALKQSGYHALHDLVFGAWYANPSTWTAIGYAGPPAVS